MNIDDLMVFLLILKFVDIMNGEQVIGDKSSVHIVLHDTVFLF